VTKPSQERAAKNQALFREMNERIRDITEVQEETWGEILCECDDLACAERIPITLREYEQVREHGDRFLILRGHENFDVEKIVEMTERYVIVEKIEHGAVIAHQLDPRTRD
jgi:hypothetical protein